VCQAQWWDSSQYTIHAAAVVVAAALLTVPAQVLVQMPSRPAYPFVLALARALAIARGSGNVDIRISSGGLQREVHIHFSIMFPRGPALSCL